MTGRRGIAVAVIIPAAVAIAMMMTLAAVACGAPASAPTATVAPSPASVSDDGAIREVTVGPEVVDCVGAHPQQCLVVDGELFYSPIDGFDHQDGYRYRLRIERYDQFPGQTEIPQDTGRYGYRLLEILEKRRG